MPLLAGMYDGLTARGMQAGGEFAAAICTGKEAVGKLPEFSFNESNQIGSPARHFREATWVLAGSNVTAAGIRDTALSCVRCAARSPRLCESCASLECPKVGARIVLADVESVQTIESFLGNVAIREPERSVARAGAATSAGVSDRLPRRLKAAAPYQPLERGCPVTTV